MNFLFFLRCQSLLFQALTALFLRFLWNSRDQSDQVLCAGVSVGSTHTDRVRHADLALSIEVTVDIRGGLDVAVAQPFLHILEREAHVQQIAR